jgi:hypothetical protein
MVVYRGLLFPLALSGCELVERLPDTVLAQRLDAGFSEFVPGHHLPGCVLPGFRHSSDRALALNEW